MNKKPLCVALDATPLSIKSGGIRRYVIELVRALASKFPEDEYHLLTDQYGILRPDEWMNLGNVHTDSLQSAPLTKKWWSIGLAFELTRRKIQVFHGTDFSIPYFFQCPSVLTLHDLSPWKSPGLLSSASLYRIRHRTPLLARMATRLITPSKAIRHEVSDFFSLPKSRIHTTQLAPSAGLIPAYNSNPSNTSASEYKVASPYLLYVGSSEPRKNLEQLIRAWLLARTTRSDLSLILVGRDHIAPNNSLEEKSLHLPGPLQDKEIAQLLSQASAFVYPSLYEGFGLPVMEAMQAGVPVITSHDAAITEIAGGAALQVDVTSQKELSEAILKVVCNSFIRKQLKEDGKQRSRQFSWESTAALTRAVYVEAISSF